MKLITYWLILLISLLFINIHGHVYKAQHLPIAVVEHKSNDIIDNDLVDKHGKTTSEKTLIRVTRTNTHLEKSIVNNRQRREIIDTDEILGMARKVAITIFVLLSLCILCLIVSIIYICIKCCSSGNSRRKRNQAFHPVPQPIIIHTNSPNYQPQHPQQQAPSPQPQLPAQIWHSENYPMLPQPSAPPRPTDDSYMDRAPQRPTDDSYMDRPPPYEKICAT